MSVAYYELLVQEDITFGTSTTVKRNPGGGSLTGTQVNIGSLALTQRKITTTYDPGEIASGATATTTVTVTGAALGDFAVASFSLDLSGLSVSAYVSATSTVTVVFANLTGSPVDLASGTLSVLVFASR